MSTEKYLPRTDLGFIIGIRETEMKWWEHAQLISMISSRYFQDDLFKN